MEIPNARGRFHRGFRVLTPTSSRACSASSAYWVPLEQPTSSFASFFGNFFSTCASQRVLRRRVLLRQPGCITAEAARADLVRSNIRNQCWSAPSASGSSCSGSRATGRLDQKLIWSNARLEVPQQHAWQPLMGADTSDLAAMQRANRTCLMKSSLGDLVVTFFFCSGSYFRTELTIGTLTEPCAPQSHPSVTRDAPGLTGCAQPCNFGLWARTTVISAMARHVSTSTCTLAKVAYCHRWSRAP